MISLYKHISRTGFTLAAAFGFTVAALFLNSTSASMQTGANTIAFDRHDSAVGYTKVFTMNADGTNVQDLGRGFDPSWSSNGARIAYGYGGSETNDIWTMNADGTDKQRLTYNWQSYAPAWSPDGARVAFASWHESGDHIYLINIDGTNQQQLIHNAAGVVREYAPSWSSDGTKVVFLGEKVVNGLARYDYYAADASNSGQTTQLTFLNALFDRAAAAVSPDGAKIVIEYDHDLQAHSLDGSGTLVNLTDGSPSSVAYPDYAPNGSKIIYTLGTLMHVMKADGTERVNLDVVGRNADWNPTAVVAEPTPTETPTPTPAVEADIDVDASVSSSSVSVGGEVTFTIDVKNLGGDAATGVTLATAFPASLTLVDLQTSQGSCAIVSGQLECQLGNIAENGQATITLKANVNTIGFASMNFAGDAIEDDPDGSNNSHSVGVTGVGQCAAPVITPIEITRAQWRPNDQDGQDELILTIRNRSGQSLDPRLIFVFDNLPQGVSVDPSVVAGYTQCSTPQGSPYVVGYAPNEREWKPMQTVSVRVLFNNPSRAAIPYDWRLYSGDVNP